MIARGRRWLVGACLVAAAARGEAQTVAPFTSNRPGIADSESLVPPHVIEIEAGMLAEGAAPVGDRHWTQTWGLFTVRAGINKRVEVFAGWDGVTALRPSGPGAIISGANDLHIGGKLALLSEPTHPLTVSIATAVSFPSGTDPFSSGSVDPSIRVLWARALPRDWSISGNLVATDTAENRLRRWQEAVMLGVGRPLTTTISAFGEIAGDLGLGTAPAWTVDAGVAWLATSDLQWDVSAGHTFGDRGDDWFLSAGIAWRHR